MSQLPTEYCRRESRYGTRYARQPHIFHVATLCFEVCLKKQVPLIQGGKALNFHCSNKLLGFQVSSHGHINSNIYSSKFGLYSLVLFTVAQGGRYLCFLLPVLVFAVYVTLNSSG
jgi:hypothetical protein